MGYYVKSDYSGYYVGDKQNSTDIAVTEQPFYTCSWDGAAWVYDLAATRIAVKNRFNDALNMDVMTVISEDANPSSFFVGLMYLALFADAVSYTDNSANDTPLYDGYMAISGLATKADVHAAIKNNYDLFGVILGKLLAQRDIYYAAIDAAATGEAITAIVYVRPF